MLTALIRGSIRYSSLVVVAAVLLTGWALWRLPAMQVDVFPELNAPTVVVMTECGGLSADEVEQHVSFPIESAVNGMTGVRRVRSASAIGLSIVWVDLDWGVDLLDARQLVAERLSAVRDRLPADAQPGITPISSIAGEIMLISMVSPEGSVSQKELRSVAEFEVRPALLAVPGVAQVVAIGGELPEYQVHADQRLLQLHGLTLEDVAAAAGDAHATQSAGYLPDVNHRELPVRQHTQVRSVDDIAETIVTFRHGVPVTIGQVADVQLGAALQRGSASSNGRPAVILSVQKSPGTNTLALTTAVDEAIDRIKSALPAGMELDRDVFRQSHFIHRSVDNVMRVLIEAAVIVSIVLLLFLVDVRATIITLTAIPVSMAVALLMMDASQMGLNVMTLGGLAIAIGVLVDDAIIDVENVVRRLKGNAALPEGERRSKAAVVLDASNEIRPSIIFATVIIVLVFVPLLFLEGLEGRFFRPLAVTYMLAIGASLLVALTLTPALCALMLRMRSGGERTHRDGMLVRALKAVYRPCLRVALRLRWLVLAAAGGLTVAAVCLASMFGTSFLPSFNEGTFTVFLMAPPGTSLVESDRLARNVEQRLISIDGVRSVSRRTGRAERDEHAEPVSNSEVEVVMSPEADRFAVRRAIDDVLDSVPGVTTMIGQPIEHRLSHVMSGTPAAIAIDIQGDDLGALRATAKQVAAALKTVPGTRDVQANREVMIQTVPVRYRPKDLAAVGLTPSSAADQLRRALHGDVVDVVNDGVRQLELVVRLSPEHRDRLEQVGDIMLHGAAGATVRLRDVADIGVQSASNLITRQNARRKAVVSLNLAEGHNLGDLIAQVRTVVDPIVAKAGLQVHYGGQFEAQQRATRTIWVAGAVMLVLMLMLLQVSTGSWRAALLVMCNLPLALVGGVAAMYVQSPDVWANTQALLGIGGGWTAPVISIASLVGFITLFGIAVRNGILLLSHYNHLLQVEGVSMREAIERGSAERLVPILMTALTAALGVLPLALAAGEPGSELLAPLAIVTLGGLLTSSVLNLFVVPAGYAILFGVSRRDTQGVD
ncbi:MAG: efflux RND transporter permease subunit [Phycisphaerales bacterium]|nr:efflux RND transporter permease subunit [Phycisphaerales bacterium]